MDPAKAISRAERKVIKAAQYLADAARELSDAGFEQAARMINSASYEAANAISTAVSRNREGQAPLIFWSNATEKGTR